MLINMSGVRFGLLGLSLLGSVATSSQRVFVGKLLNIEVGSTTCNVLNYGAKGDGVSDDTKAIQAAISACSTSTGGVTSLPAGYT